MAIGNFIYTLSIFIIASYLLSGIFIVSVRGTKPPMLYILLNRFLGAFFAIVNLLQTAHTPIYGHLLWNPLHVLMSLILYPLLFTYIFALLRPGSVGVRFQLNAYVPIAALAALYFTFEALFGRLPLFSTYAGMRNYFNFPQLWVLFGAAGFSVILMIHYTVRAITVLRQHKRNLESEFSSAEGNTLGWVWWAIGIAMFEWLVVLACVMFEGNIGQLTGLILFTVEPIVITVFVLRQKDLYSRPTERKDHIPKPEVDVPEWSPENRKKLKQDLLALLKKDEIFKDPELSNEKVREMLNTNRTYLWQVINQDMNTTFYKLINTWRLNKSVSMMKNPLHRDMPLSSIAEICGFKSLRAFSTLFKQTYGKTPTEWRMELFYC